MTPKNSSVGAGPGGTGDNHSSDYQQHFSINPAPKRFPFETNLPGLLAQADTRQRRAESAGDTVEAVAHLSIWLELHPVVNNYGGE